MGLYSVYTTLTFTLLPPLLHHFTNKTIFFQNASEDALFTSHDINLTFSTSNNIVFQKLSQLQLHPLIQFYRTNPYLWHSQFIHISFSFLFWYMIHRSMYLPQSSCIYSLISYIFLSWSPQYCICRSLLRNWEFCASFVKFILYLHLFRRITFPSLKFIQDDYHPS